MSRIKLLYLIPIPKDVLSGIDPGPIKLALLMLFWPLWLKVASTIVKMSNIFLVLLLVLLL